MRSSLALKLISLFSTLLQSVGSSGVSINLTASYLINNTYLPMQQESVPDSYTLEGTINNAPLLFHVRFANSAIS